MTAAAAELQKSIFGALTGEAGLLAALGGPRIYDHVPTNVAFPYVTFGRTSVFDWSTSTESGTEHLFTLHVWSKAKGKDEVHALMERIRERLHDGQLVIDGFDLVNLRLEFVEARFNDDLAVYHGMLRFRATIEAVAG